MARITRQGARNVTLDLDKIASLFQDHHELMGIPQKIAADFAYRCDLISDHVERHVLAMEKSASEEEEGKEGAAAEKPQTEIDDDPASDDQNKPEHYYHGKNAEDETGLSVEPTGGFDPNEIADKKSGPLEAPPAEEGVEGHFTQVNFQQLCDKEEGPGVGTQVDKFAAEEAVLAAMLEEEGMTGKAAGDDDDEDEEKDSDEDVEKEASETEASETEAAPVTEAAPETFHGYNLFA